MRWVIDDYEYMMESGYYVYVHRAQTGSGYASQIGSGYSTQRKAVQAARRMKDYNGAGIKIRTSHGWRTARLSPNNRKVRFPANRIGGRL